MTAPVTDITTADADTKRRLALLKAVGLDRVAPEARELAVSIATRYELDLLLKHLVLIEGRPFVTRDGLMHVAHRSGQLDGIQVPRPTLEGDFWRTTATVWRKDMTHPFEYPGRYPAKGGNQRYCEEMCIKVAESMALRRAFDVAAPVLEERWESEVPESVATTKPTFAEKVEERARVIGPKVTDGMPPAIAEIVALSLAAADQDDEVTA